MRLNYTFSNLCGTVYRQGNLLFSADGNKLFAAVGNRVSCYDLVSSRCFTFPFEARRNITRLALSPDGTTLVTIDDQGRLLLVNVHRRVVLAHLNLKVPVADAQFSPDGKYIAFATGRLLQLWAAPALERSFSPFALHKTMGGHADDITCIAWSRDSLFVASGGKDLCVKVHSLHTLPTYVPATLSGHRSSVRAVFFDESGETIYAVARDGGMSVWRVRPRPDADPMPSYNLTYTPTPLAAGAAAARCRSKGGGGGA
jgi:periodic tryptophan protein 2